MGWVCDEGGSGGDQHCCGQQVGRCNTHCSGGGTVGWVGSDEFGGENSRVGAGG